MTIQVILLLLIIRTYQICIIVIYIYHIPVYLLLENNKILINKIQLDINLFFLVLLFDLF